MTRALVAMSGGVDSAVAAALLVRKGWEVVGVTAHLVDLSAKGLGVSRCCSPRDIETARAVAWHLGIPHYVVDMEGDFRTHVLDPFVDQYLDGTTPSPCIRCNSLVKLGGLFPVADQLDARFIASGHYARIEPGPEGEPALLRAVDRERDQSYFLFDFSTNQLGRMRFPLGDLTKAEVRQLALAMGLPNAGRRDSQEVCFVPRNASYRDVLERLAPHRSAGRGEIVDGHGNVLGTHTGIHQFTVGQRRGLGLSGREAWYVVKIEPRTNRVVVGSRDGLARRSVLLDGVRWLTPEPASGLRADIKVRARHEAQPGLVTSLPDGRALVVFREAVTAPAPGQAAVFYVGERVMGGGWISREPDGEGERSCASSRVPVGSDHIA